MGDDDTDYVDAGMAAWQKLMEMKIDIDDGSKYWAAEKSNEEILREQYPTLQDAWDKYQSILKLCSVDHNAKIR